MELTHGLHLAYCTDVHGGETWAETLMALEEHTLQVKDWVAPESPYAIGLRLSARAAAELLAGDSLAVFRRWLEEHDCYVFTINGFLYGGEDGRRLKEDVFRPDWSTPERAEYTRNLFTILSELMSGLPAGIQGSVSTLPATFKAFAPDASTLAAIQANLLGMADHLADLEDRTGRRFVLGLEPTPLAWFETTLETIAFFHELREAAGNGGQGRVDRHLGVTYDGCHQAVEFEAAAESLFLLREAGLTLAKIHLSNALCLKVGSEALTRLRALDEPTTLHQVIGLDREAGEVYRYIDLADALGDVDAGSVTQGEEWHAHFHVPLQCLDAQELSTTGLHITSLLDNLENDPGLCPYLEIETHCWDLLPEGLRRAELADRLAYEYAWTLAQLKARGFQPLHEA